MLEIGTDVEIITMRWWCEEPYGFLMSTGVVVSTHGRFFKRYHVRYVIPGFIVQEGCFKASELNVLHDAPNAKEPWVTNVT